MGRRVAAVAPSSGLAHSYSDLPCSACDSAFPLGSKSCHRTDPAKTGSVYDDDLQSQKMKKLRVEVSSSPDPYSGS